MGKTTPYLVDEIEKVVDAVRENSFDLTFDESFQGLAPFYMYGHPLEIANNLLAMGADNVLKYRRYPLFALKLDQVEDVEDNMVQYDLNIAILSMTEPHFTSDERTAQVFKPMLYPLYNKFMDALQQCGFIWDGEWPPHKKIDRYFWGMANDIRQNRSQGNAAYIFNDPLDAIEIVNLRIKKELVCL